MTYASQPPWELQPQPAASREPAAPSAYDRPAYGGSAYDRSSYDASGYDGSGYDGSAYASKSYGNGYEGAGYAEAAYTEAPYDDAYDVAYDAGYDSLMLDANLLRAAQQLYRDYCESQPDTVRRPVGIAIHRLTHRGKPIFTEKPILLPEECFIPLNQIESEMY